MGAPAPRTAVQRGRDVDLRLTLLERALAGAGFLPSRLQPGGADVLSSVYGTTAERDALFGVPATDAERVALANRKVLWFNTDSGWEESFYTPAGLTGLSVRGLVPGAPAGWYPVSQGPWIHLVAAASQSMGSGSVFINWADPGVGRSARHGAAWFTHVKASGYIRCERAGRYEIRANCPCQAGAGSGALYLSKNAGTSGDGVVSLQSFTLQSNQPTNVWMDSLGYLAAPGDFFRVYAGAVGSAVFCLGADSNNPRFGEFSVRYVAPPLASD